MKSKLICFALGAFFVLMIAATTPVFRLVLQGDADGRNYSFTNLSTIRATNAVLNLANSTNLPGSGLQSSSVNSNRFDAATLAMFGAGGGFASNAIANLNGFGTNTTFYFDSSFLVGTNSNLNGTDPSDLIGVIMIGAGHTLASAPGEYVTISGGQSNFVSNGSDYPTIAGGFNNIIGVQGDGSVISGGRNNNNPGSLDSVIAGGNQNIIAANAHWSSIAGGRSNTVNAEGSFIAGRSGTINNLGSFLWSDGATVRTSSLNSSVVFYASNGFAINTNNPSGYGLNVVGAINASGGVYSNGVPIGGGGAGTVTSITAGEGLTGGEITTTGTIEVDTNTIATRAWVDANDDGSGATITGITNNPSIRLQSTNLAFGINPNVVIEEGNEYSAVLSGVNGTIVGGASGSVIAGGQNNNILGVSGQAYVQNAIGGGADNIITNSAQYATIPGGFGNVVGGAGANQGSMAAGSLAHALHNATFVWSDGNATFETAVEDSFIIQAANGVGINTNNPGDNALKVAGNVDATGFSIDGAPLSSVIQYDVSTINADGFLVTNAANALGTSSGAMVTMFTNGVAPGEYPITGLAVASQTTGRIRWIINDTGVPFIFSNNVASLYSSILTGNGEDLITGTNTTTIQFLYDTDRDRWRVVNMWPMP